MNLTSMLDGYIWREAQRERERRRVQIFRIMLNKKWQIR